VIPWNGDDIHRAASICQGVDGVDHGPGPGVDCVKVSAVRQDVVAAFLGAIPAVVAVPYVAA
jgi:hypothetical protein